jgi:hypothetical protein
MSDRQRGGRSAVGGYASHDRRLIGEQAIELINIALADALQRSQVP